jgi:hypothetical protein
LGDLAGIRENQEFGRLLDIRFIVLTGYGQGKNQST